MDTRFLPHNTHLESPTNFQLFDPHLKQLNKQKLIYFSPTIHALPQNEPGIYSITGGRQIGKTTLIKQWMSQLMANDVYPGNIRYLTGELIDNHHMLVSIISNILSHADMNMACFFIIIDEVTYINNWDKGIKYLADAGILENVVLIVTGSDTLIIQEAIKRFPGRRGLSDTVDFHISPLNFYETVKLKKIFDDCELFHLMNASIETSPELIERLFSEFNYYLCHGGFLTAINDMVSHGKIRNATCITYSDWIRGDFLKNNKQEHYLKEIVFAIIQRYASQITWNSLAKEMSIDHPKTISDYIELLSRMDVLFVQHAIREDKLSAAPKKAKKVIFTDPFIFHAINAWLNPSDHIYSQNISAMIHDPVWSSKIAEACAISHYHQKYPTYYIKAAGEVDIAYVHQNKMFPVEIKWTHNIQSYFLKQLKKYSNGKILTRLKTSRKVNDIDSEPLPLALLKLV